MPKRKPLNFLLIMPRLVQNTSDGYVFPLGIAYISSSLKKAGFRVFTLNLNHVEISTEGAVSQAILQHDIHVVATGGLSPQYHMVKAVIDAAKRCRPEVKIVVGGGIISADPKPAMIALDCVDFGIIGEGEQAMCELAAALETGGDVAAIDGLVYSCNGTYELTATRKDIEDINSIPWPDYEGFDIEKYLDAPSAGFAGINKGRMICLLGSRSCPFNCSFCFHTNGKKYRQRSLDDFFAELDYMVSRYKIDYLSLADELFSPNRERVLEFCRRIKKYHIKWYADFRVDKIHPDLLSVMKDSGLEVMFFGIESADDRILKSMRKGITVEQIEAALKQVYAAAIPIYGCFIFGDVAETMETARNTFKWWREHAEYHIHLTLVKPFPGSAIYEYACSQGLIKDRVQYLKDGCPQVNISRLNDVEFSEVMRQISEISSRTMPLNSVELLKVDALMGRESVSGICGHCRQKNTWENIKLFAIDYLYCSNCGQKFDIPLPDRLLHNIEKNLRLLLDRYGKVAIWGMTIPVMDLFPRSRLLMDDRIFAVDIAESKQRMDLHGKKVYSPQVLTDQAINAVVIGVPSHGGQISCQIAENHGGVKKVIDICHLVDDEPVV